MDEAEKQALENLQTELFAAEKTLKKAIKQAEQCYVIDRMQVQVGNQIGGLSMEEAFKKELKYSAETKSKLQLIIEDALEMISKARSDALSIRWANKK